VVGSSAPSGVVSRAIDAVETYQKMLNRELKLGADSATQLEAKPEPETKVVVAQDRWR
jgi:hypothetical protein